VPVGVLGLVVPAYAIIPVTFGVATAFSVLCAVWVSNALTRGTSRGRLLWVLLVCEATALVLMLVLWGIAATGLGRELLALSEFETLFLSMVPIAVNATVLTWRSREAGSRNGRDFVLTMIVAGAAVAAPVLLLVVGCPLIGCSG
jgi:hypothetical protein